MTRTEIRNHFSRNKSSEEIGRALDRLLALGLVTVGKVETGGLPAEKWRAAK